MQLCTKNEKAVLAAIAEATGLDPKAAQPSDILDAIPSRELSAEERDTLKAEGVVEFFAANGIEDDYEGFIARATSDAATLTDLQAALTEAGVPVSKTEDGEDAGFTAEGIKAHIEQAASRKAADIAAAAGIGEGNTVKPEAEETGDKPETKEDYLDRYHAAKNAGDNKLATEIFKEMEALFYSK